MFGSQILEVAIGIIFVYLITSVICSTIREGLEAWLKTRAAYLEHGIRELLHSPSTEGGAIDLADSFYKHPLIFGLFSGEYKTSANGRKPSLFANGKNLPSYVPSRNFALALMDIAARGPQTDVVSSDPASPVISLNNIRANIMNLNNPAVQRVLLTALDSAQNDIDKLQKNIEDWFNSSMDRISGWYKRSTHWIIFIISLVVSIGFNINTITIADYLYRNDAARAAIVARAEALANDTTFKTDSAYNAAKRELQSVDLPIGWMIGEGALKSGHGAIESGEAPERVNWFWYVLVSIPGWLLTALAATMGAPFWFDLLNKVMVIRSTVKPTEKSKDEASEDRQLPQKKTTTAVTVDEGAQQAKPVVVVQQPIAMTPEFVQSVDAESHLDGCSVDFATDPTDDKDLPPAEGGVA
jgi:hypothetical protein